MCPNFTQSCFSEGSGLSNLFLTSPQAPKTSGREGCWEAHKQPRRWAESRSWQGTARGVGRDHPGAKAGLQGAGLTPRAPSAEAGVGKRHNLPSPPPLALRPRFPTAHLRPPPGLPGPACPLPGAYGAHPQSVPAEPLQGLLRVRSPAHGRCRCPCTGQLESLLGVRPCRPSPRWGTHTLPPFSPAPLF